VEVEVEKLERASCVEMFCKRRDAVFIHRSNRVEAMRGGGEKVRKQTENVIIAEDFENSQRNLLILALLAALQTIRLERKKDVEERYQSWAE
jgi:hypothetical protein